MEEVSLAACQLLDKGVQSSCALLPKGGWDWAGGVLRLSPVHLSGWTPHWLPFMDPYQPRNSFLHIQPKRGTPLALNSSGNRAHKSSEASYGESGQLPASVSMKEGSGLGTSMGRRV